MAAALAEQLRKVDVDVLVFLRRGLHGEFAADIEFRATAAQRQLQPVGRLDVEGDGLRRDDVTAVCIAL